MPYMGILLRELWMPSLGKTRFMKIKAKKIRIAYVSILLALLIYAFLIEPNWVQVTHHQLVSRDKARKVRIVQVSDLHLHQYGWREQRVIDELSRINPDLMLLTGDVIDRADSLPALNTFLTAAGDVPKLAVLGNWEHWAEVDLAALGNIYEKHAARLLINQTARLDLHGTLVDVAGLDDYTAGKPAAALLSQPLTDGDLAILVQHSPGMFDDRLFDRAHNLRLDLCLSGHTHAGQIALFGFPLWKPPGSGTFTAGMYSTTNCPLYVSRGIGTSLLPARFGARPEIAVFEF